MLCSSRGHIVVNVQPVSADRHHAGISLRAGVASPDLSDAGAQRRRSALRLRSVVFEGRRSRSVPWETSTRHLQSVCGGERFRRCAEIPLYTALRPGCAPRGPDRRRVPPMLFRESPSHSLSAGAQQPAPRSHASPRIPPSPRRAQTASIPFARCAPETSSLTDDSAVTMVPSHRPQALRRRPRSWR